MHTLVCMEVHWWTNRSVKTIGHMNKKQEYHQYLKTKLHSAVNGLIAVEVKNKLT